jgi:hypothetical protein
VNYEDEALVSAPPSDEENEVSHFPFQFFDDTLFYDSEGEEIKKPLEELRPSFSDEDMTKEMSFGDDVLDPLPFDEVIQTIDIPA